MRIATPHCKNVREALELISFLASASELIPCLMRMQAGMLFP